MATPNETSSTTKAPAFMQVHVKGRIDARRRHEKTTYTRILTPAPDAYSRPQTIEIRSKGTLGQVGDEVIVLAQLGGYTRKPFRSTDKETGEVSTVTPVDMTLDAIE
ncbi:MAG: single-stranded DNA-binding protein [Acidovorax sp.]|nr:single-stranded DNA-binding protein [Acidovorax sp.]